MNQPQMNSLSQEPIILPRLKAAIATLDLQLETEVELYQKAKLGINSLRVLQEESPSPAVSSIAQVYDTTNLLNVEPQNGLENSLVESETNNIVTSTADEPESSGFWNFLLSPATIFSLFFFLAGTGILSAVLLTEAYKSASNKPIPEQKAPTPDLSRNEPPIEEIALSQPKVAETPSKPTEETVQAPTEKVPQAGDLSTVLLPKSLRDETQPQAVKLPASMNLDYYYVVSKYTGNNSLKKAQNVVKDAYLINLKEGLGIIMGAYERREDAVLFSKELQKKGLSNFVYHPKKEMQQDKQKQ